MLQSRGEIERSSTYLNLPCTGVSSLLTSPFKPLNSEITLSKKAGTVVGLGVGGSVGEEVGGTTGAELTGAGPLEGTGTSSSGKGWKVSGLTVLIQSQVHDSIILDLVLHIRQGLLQHRNYFFRTSVINCC